MDVVPGNSAVITSIAGGDWNNTSTQDCSCVPATTDDIIVDSSHVILLTGNTTMVNLTINSDGQLDATASYYNINIKGTSNN